MFNSPVLHTAICGETYGEAGEGLAAFTIINQGIEQISLESASVAANAAAKSQAITPHQTPAHTTATAASSAPSTAYDPDAGCLVERRIRCAQGLCLSRLQGLTLFGCNDGPEKGGCEQEEYSKDLLHL
jgi:hypothetical protein